MAILVLPKTGEYFARSYLGMHTYMTPSLIADSNCTNECNNVQLNQGLVSSAEPDRRQVGRLERRAAEPLQKPCE